MGTFFVWAVTTQGNKVQKDNRKQKLRVLVFTDPDLSSIFTELSSFADVKQVNWQYRPIEGGLVNFGVKLPYRLLEGLFWILKLFREIYMYHADIVVAQYAHFGGLIGAIAAMSLRRRFILRAVGSDLKIQSKSFIGTILVQITFKISSGVICVSKDLEKIARKLGAKSTIAVPSSIDPIYFNEIPHKKSDRRIISIARLVPVKGVNYLIKAMKHIKKGTLVIVGDGPERVNLELLSHKLNLTNRVVFAGWIADRSRLRDLLCQANVFVMSSLSEGSPRAILEAMACGLPIVATDVGGIPEIVTDGVNGFLVPSKNEKALAEAINKVLSDIDFQRSASIRNKRVAKKFISPNAAQYIHNYLTKIMLHS